MRKRWLTLAALAVATVLLASMFAALRGSSASAAHKAAFSACLVTDIGGLNDKSFNHLAFVGLQAARSAGVKGRVIQSKSAADYIPNLKACVNSGAGVTIGVGFLMADAMDAIATRVPEEQVRDRRRRRDVDEAQAEERPRVCSSRSRRRATSSATRQVSTSSPTAARRSAPSAVSRSRRSIGTSPATSSARRRPTRASRR